VVIQRGAIISDRMGSINFGFFWDENWKIMGKMKRLMMLSGFNHQQPGTRKKCLHGPSSIVCLGCNHEHPRGLFDKLIPIINLQIV
jgi:hypothetical protein